MASPVKVCPKDQPAQASPTECTGLGPGATGSNRSQCRETMRRHKARGWCPRWFLLLVKNWHYFKSSLQEWVFSRALRHQPPTSECLGSTPGLPPAFNSVLMQTLGGRGHSSGHWALASTQEIQIKFQVQSLCPVQPASTAIGLQAVSQQMRATSLHLSLTLKFKKQKTSFNQIII